MTFGGNIARPTGPPDWQTPGWMLDIVREAIGPIELDPTPGGPKAKRRIGNSHSLRDATVERWPEVETCFMNPPFSPSRLSKDLYSRFFNEHLRRTFKRGCAVRILNGMTAAYTIEHMERTKARALLLPRVAFIDPDTQEPVAGNSNGIALIFVGVKRDVLVRIGKREGYLLAEFPWR